MGYYSEVLQRSLARSYELVKLLLSDLSDDELLVRPVPEATCIAWELGHLILRDYRLLGSQGLGVNYPELPIGFEQQHSDATAGSEPPVGFLCKAEYMNLLATIHQATISALASLADTDLDAPAKGEARTWAMTLGDVCLQAVDERGAELGQLTIVRRKLGKPILF